MSRIHPLAAVAAVVTLAACSGGSSTPDTSSQASTTIQTSVPATTVATTSAPPTTGTPSTSTTPSTAAPTSTAVAESAAAKFDVPYSAEDAALVDRAAPVVELWLKTLWRDARNIPFEYPYSEYWRDVAHHDTAESVFTGPANIPGDSDPSSWALNQGMDLRGALWNSVWALDVQTEEEAFENSWILLEDPLFEVSEVDTAQYLNTDLLSDPPYVDRSATSLSVVWPVFIEMYVDYGGYLFTVERHFAVQLTDNAAGELRIIGEHDLGAAQFVASTGRADLIADGVVLEPPLEIRPSR